MASLGLPCLAQSSAQLLMGSCWVLAPWQLPCRLRRHAAAVLPAPLLMRRQDAVLTYLAETLPIAALLRCPAAAVPSRRTAAHPR